MYMKKYYFITLLFFYVHAYAQPCYNTSLVTSAYATGGTGLYKKEILWLTWGGKNQNNLYGTDNVNLTTGSKSYASIPLGNNKYLCVEATIEKIAQNNIKSYKPGNYAGDSMDDWYNIGGTNTNNKLIAGIVNSISGEQVHFRIKCKATISGMPVRLKGIVVADAESMSGTEYIRAKADGNWNVLEVKKNLTAGGNYYVRKDTGKNLIQFGGGNDRTTAALALLKFNDSAYQGTDFEITTEVVLKGEGNQAIAIGLVTPDVDFSDAPDYYGYPIHTLEKMAVTNDNINAQGSFSMQNIANQSGIWYFDGNNRRTNINTGNYTPATFNKSVSSEYLGTAKAEANLIAVNGPHADKDGFATNEEDAWPAQFNRFSYKDNKYKPGETISINIPYFSEKDAYVTAWIDFDGNGKFGSNSNENVTKSNGNISRNANTNPEFAFAKVTRNTTKTGTATLTWIVPQNRVARSTFVRLRIAEVFDEISNPISAAVDGEIEDHKIQIFAPVATNPVLYNKS